jgi:hypothetical protein
VLVVGVQLLEELSDVHAGAIREVPGFVLVRGIVTAYIADDEFAEGFEIATTELHKSIVAGSVDGHRPRREHAPSEPAYGDGITW